MKDTRLFFRVSEKEKQEFEDMATKNGLSKSDLFRFKAFHQTDLDARIEQIITSTSKNLEMYFEEKQKENVRHFEEKQKENVRHFEEKQKELQAHFEERFKAYANALFKSVVENVDQKLNLEKRDYRDFVDERLDSLFHRIDQKHFRILNSK